MILSSDVGSMLGIMEFPLQWGILVVAPLILNGEEA